LAKTGSLGREKAGEELSRRGGAGGAPRWAGAGLGSARLGCGGAWLGCGGAWLAREPSAVAQRMATSARQRRRGLVARGLGYGGGSGW